LGGGDEKFISKFFGHERDYSEGFKLARVGEVAVVAASSEKNERAEFVVCNLDGRRFVWCGQTCA
jgi:hypothetical protein